MRTWIRSGVDDVEEMASGSMVTGSSVKDLDFSASGNTVGLRFTGVTIPQGAKITEAYVKFRANETDSGDTLLSIRADNSDDAKPFSTSSRNLSSRSKTSASASWRPGPWSAGEVFQTDSIVSVVQEVVNRSGWGSGNPLVLLFTGDNEAQRVAVSVDGGGTRSAATLYVWYETDDGGDDGGGDDGGDGGGGDGVDGSGGGSSGELATWNSRLVATIENPRYDNYNGWMNPRTQAATGDLFQLGRMFNFYVTSLSLAYRETGDEDLIKQLAALMDIAKSKLRDTNGDGFLNWIYDTRTDSSSVPFLGNDYHRMDEMLTHSMVAAVAYTLKQAGYSSDAAYWTNYLKNHFEKKWRGRNNKPSGFPFITHPLTHPTTQFIRYNYYMSKLTGDSSYYSEAKRLTGLVKRNTRLIGSSRVWSHFSRENGQVGQDCAPTVYTIITTQAMADLATRDSSFFDSTFMKQIANAMATKVLKNTDGTALAANICGKDSYGTLWYFVSYPYSQLARWDDTGRLELATRRAYATTEYRQESPRIYNLPAMMVFLLGK